MGVAASRAGTAHARAALGGGVTLLAVADGFGRVDGVPVASVAIARLRDAFERRARTERFHRMLERPEVASALLAAEIARANEAVFARSASHADYVAAGCSLTAVLIVRRRATVAHVGATAAQISRGGRARILTPHHVAGDLPVRLLTRALGAYPRVELALCAADIEDGDTLALLDAGGRPAIVHRCDRCADEGPAAAARSRISPPAIAAAIAFFLLALSCVR